MNYYSYYDGGEGDLKKALPYIGGLFVVGIVVLIILFATGVISLKPTDAASNVADKASKAANAADKAANAADKAADAALTAANEYKKQTGTNLWFHATNDVNTLKCAGANGLVANATDCRFSKVEDAKAWCDVSANNCLGYLVKDNVYYPVNTQPVARTGMVSEYYLKSAVV